MSAQYIRTSKTEAILAQIFAASPHSQSTAAHFFSWILRLASVLAFSARVIFPSAPAQQMARAALRLATTWWALVLVPIHRGRTCMPPREEAARATKLHMKEEQKTTSSFFSAVHGIGRVHLMAVVFDGDSVYYGAARNPRSKPGPMDEVAGFKTFGTNCENCWRGGLLLASNICGITYHENCWH